MNNYKYKLNNEINILSNLVDMENPQRVLYEVRIIISTLFPEFDFKGFNQVFFDIIRLFRGEFYGYQKCNTEYHDLKHITDTLLAMTRLIHGYLIKNKDKLSEKSVYLGLLSALMHDTGYIQTLDDTFGTGAKYTLEHISRSILFIEKYFAQHNYSKDDLEFCKNCLLCTGYSIKLDEIHFSSDEEELLGKMMGTADLLGQMSSRDYLEKLLFLYYEFREGNVIGFESELDLLKKTLVFYHSIKEKFTRDFSNVIQYVIYHFQERWNIDKNLYYEAIEKNIQYLQYILDNHMKNYHDYLRRSGIAKNLNKKGLYTNG